MLLCVSCSLLQCNIFFMTYGGCFVDRWPNLAFVLLCLDLQCFYLIGFVFVHWTDICSFVLIDLLTILRLDAWNSFFFSLVNDMHHVLLLSRLVRRNFICNIVVSSKITSKIFYLLFLSVFLLSAQKITCNFFCCYFLAGFLHCQEIVYSRHFLFCVLSQIIGYLFC